ncbi:hypothetical protein JOB18_007348 [Solea senegalensis]|uniref:Uncharacterized protein n=1 Tax=Solea senegalensis TaxID=28829 RepID=A0AAV6R6C9_SOLSE|nr:hypothetical protein JOB18_007348 [Solea senegalensis]
MRLTKRMDPQQTAPGGLGLGQDHHRSSTCFTLSSQKPSSKQEQIFKIHNTHTQLDSSLLVLPTESELGLDVDYMIKGKFHPQLMLRCISQYDFNRSPQIRNELVAFSCQRVGGESRSESERVRYSSIKKMEHCQQQESVSSDNIFFFKSDVTTELSQTLQPFCVFAQLSFTSFFTNGFLGVSSSICDPQLGAAQCSHALLAAERVEHLQV